MDTTLFAYLREHPPKGHSLEYADCRLSLLSAQKGKCAVSVGWFFRLPSLPVRAAGKLLSPEAKAKLKAKLHR